MFVECCFRGAKVTINLKIAGLFNNEFRKLKKDSYLCLLFFNFVNMYAIKKLFDFYIRASFHVSMAVLALVLMTNHMFAIPFDVHVASFAFCGTFLGYNFIKYEVYFRKKMPFRKKLLPIFILSFFALLACLYLFFQLKIKTQIVSVIFLGLTFLYAVPVFSSKTNMRNWSGIKIYIVAFCWAGVTVLLPIFNYAVLNSEDVLIKFFQRFILIVVLILIFEIIDLKNDEETLATVPQRLGVQKTKQLGALLLVVFYFLEFLKSDFQSQQLLVNLFLICITFGFLFYAHQNRNKYYTSFWVESIPILWLLLVYLTSF